MRLPALKDFPSEFHVGEETYQIRLVSRFPGEDQKLSGLCCGSTHTIYLRRGMTKSQAFRSLVHELLHAIEFEYELKIPHKLVYHLERAISDLLLQNF